jgi:hypothetical protein
MTAAPSPGGRWVMHFVQLATRVSEARKLNYSRAEAQPDAG